MCLSPSHKGIQLMDASQCLIHVRFPLNWIMHEHKQQWLSKGVLIFVESFHHLNSAWLSSQIEEAFGRLLSNKRRRFVPLLFLCVFIMPVSHGGTIKLSEVILQWTRPKWPKRECREEVRQWVSEGRGEISQITLKPPPLTKNISTFFSQTCIFLIISCSLLVSFGKIWPICFQLPPSGPHCQSGISSIPPSFLLSRFHLYTSVCCTDSESLRSSRSVHSSFTPLCLSEHLNLPFCPAPPSYVSPSLGSLLLELLSHGLQTAGLKLSGSDWVFFRVLWIHSGPSWDEKLHRFFQKSLSSDSTIYIR